MVKKPLLLILTALMCGVLLPAPVKAEQGEPHFFTSIQDVPLMPGLTEIPEYTVTFDKPEGRIIESVAEIESLTETDITSFYSTALPQLGWARIAEGSFVRRDEQLDMSVETVGGQDFLKIMVRPRE